MFLEYFRSIELEYSGKKISYVKKTSLPLTF